jgi:hypothetical protein
VAPCVNVARELFCCKERDSIGICGVYQSGEQAADFAGFVKEVVLLDTAGVPEMLDGRDACCLNAI